MSGPVWGGEASYNELVQILAKFTSISKTSILNASIAANTNFLSSALSPTNTPCMFRIYITLSVGGVLSVERSVGGTTVAEQLNSGNALTANCAYIFDIVVDSGETINFQTSVAATILKFSVREIDASSS